jgi:hypothetical protein
MCCSCCTAFCFIARITLRFCFAHSGHSQGASARFKRADKRPMHCSKTLPIRSPRQRAIAGTDHRRIGCCQRGALACQSSALVAAHRLTVGQAAAHLQLVHGLDNERVADAQSCPFLVSSRMPTDTGHRLGSVGLVPVAQELHWSCLICIGRRRGYLHHHLRGACNGALETCPAMA